MALAVALPGTATTEVAQGQGVTTSVAVDTDSEGNSPRTVGGVEECVSVDVGQPVVVDIVVPEPGVPADRGVAAYQFDLLYDPNVVWVQADDGDMLLAQAPGSNLIPIADPKPDTNGVYVSWVLDFGPSGIEPAGSSETGAGVLARLTLMPRNAGTSYLTLSNVLVIDDEGERIDLGPVQRGAVNVGQPCPGEDVAAPEPEDESPSGALPEPSGQDEPAPESSEGDEGVGQTAPVSQSQPSSGSAAVADTVPSAGGAPPAAVQSSRSQIAIGLAMALAGAAALALDVLTRRRWS